MKYILIIVIIFLATMSNATGMVEKNQRTCNLNRRVPAEWEKQSSTWMQFARSYESSFQTTFLSIIKIIQNYQTVNLIVENNRMKKKIVKSLNNNLNNIEFHEQKYDNSWLRDNGPIYVENNDGELILQNWEFDAWGKYKDALGWKKDNKIPIFISDRLNMKIETFPLILERGNIEFNGISTAIINYPCMKHRNKDWSREAMEYLFKSSFGITKIVWLETIPPSDEITKGHTDGIARFINANTVVVAETLSKNDIDAVAYDDAAKIIAAAGFNIIRLKGNKIRYKGIKMSTNYINWLVGNGFIIIPGFNDIDADAIARKQIKQFYPQHDIHQVDIRELWYYGGGIHCVTNDVPSFSIN